MRVVCHGSVVWEFLMCGLDELGVLECGVAAVLELRNILCCLIGCGRLCPRVEGLWSSYGRRFEGVDCFGCIRACRHFSWEYLWLEFEFVSF